MRFIFQQIVLYCHGLRTQNPGLKYVDLEPSRKRGSGKIKKKKLDLEVYWRIDLGRNTLESDWNQKSLVFPWKFTE